MANEDLQKSDRDQLQESMTNNSAVTFYDIASNAPLRTFAPNPWKTRLALNHKGVDYKTEWIHLPNIAPLREKLGVPANRTLPDGSPFHTLPVIHDHSKGDKLVGDTFEIALYLDQAYPDAPALFRPGSVGLTAAFNARIDALFTPFAILNKEMPFDPSVKDETMAMFAARAGQMSADWSPQTPEQREETFAKFEAALGELAKAYCHTGGTTDHLWRSDGTKKEASQRAPPGREEGGVFLDGEEPVYSDFIVGAWLKMMETCMAEKDWARVRSWQGGLWGRLVDALNRGGWCDMK